MMMDDSIDSIQDIEFFEIPQSSNSTRPNKVQARSRNTVSLSALAVSISLTPLKYHIF